MSLPFVHMASVINKALGRLLTAVLSRCLLADNLDTISEMMFINPRYNYILLAACGLTLCGKITSVIGQLQRLLSSTLREWSCITQQVATLKLYLWTMYLK